MARKFLYIFAGLIVLVLAVLVGLRIWADDLTEIAFVPTAKFEPQPRLAAETYAAPEMWIARPGLGEKNPALWVPDGLEEDADAIGAAVFFIHPTTYFNRKMWNAPIDEPESRQRARLFVKGMASPFNKSEDIWAPRYRQAAFGAFLTGKPEATEALDAAYGDIIEAFDYFVKSIDKDAPIVLAGHSQGGYHLRRLIHDRIAGTPLAPRIAAAYVIGWPLSLDHDLPEMGLPACEEQDQPSCIMSWASFAEPADFGQLLGNHERGTGLDGESLKDDKILCSNPLTGKIGGNADASENQGTLLPDLETESGELLVGMIPARCGKDGLLYIGPPPDLDLGPYVLPGNNYHLFDITLFWANLRSDFTRRVKAWKPQS